MSAQHGSSAGLSALRSQRLIAYAMGLFLLVALVQVTASILFYEAIDQNALHQDHARRVAELLVVSDRIHRFDPALTARTMSSHYLDVRVASQPSIKRPADDEGAVTRIREHIVAWEPGLAARDIMLSIVRGTSGRRDLVGSMALTDGAWLNFRSRDISSGWPIVLRAIAATLAIALLCVAFGLYGLHLLAMPLNRLSQVMARLVSDHPEPLEERGPADIRGLFRSFNEMQARISDLEDNQSKSFEAISHDLRTPISRLKLAASFVSDTEISRIVHGSATEMEAMIMSLQTFLRAEHLESDLSSFDLTALVAGLLGRYGAQAVLEAPAQAVVRTYRESLELALEPLFDNALQYGSRLSVLVCSSDKDWIIEIDDDGPGIAEQHFAAVLDPFFRADEARARDTPGFGLGIPTAHRLLTRFGGALSFHKNAIGGTTVRVTVRSTADAEPIA
ncbi:HAMP domain-containing histidine kinase [Sphingobium sp. H33]|uniref:histidine kinase n=2 Tax=Sphingobium nicotianae TaxID=2782607 RepID=A0A9X1DE91_9SPHN|nr:HAMP domain-containing histidine kinase [Sphingobium nicotianae]